MICMMCWKAPNTHTHTHTHTPQLILTGKKNCSAQLLLINSYFICTSNRPGLNEQNNIYCSVHFQLNVNCKYLFMIMVVAFVVAIFVVALFMNCFSLSLFPRGFSKSWIFMTFALRCGSRNYTHTHTHTHTHTLLCQQEIKRLTEEKNKSADLHTCLTRVPLFAQHVLSV